MRSQCDHQRNDGVVMTLELISVQEEGLAVREKQDASSRGLVR
jgi:hypothetical protein